MKPESDDLIRDAWGALNFILAFYDPNQRYLDTNAWKACEANARSVHARLAQKMSKEIKYMVSGGIYTDTTFTDLESGTEETYGPFPKYCDAFDVWNSGTRRNLDTCCHRLFITTE